jgi:hypothetical protein
MFLTIAKQCNHVTLRAFLCHERLSLVHFPVSARRVATR